MKIKLSNFYSEQGIFYEIFKTLKYFKGDFSYPDSRVLYKKFSINGFFRERIVLISVTLDMDK